MKPDMRRARGDLVRNDPNTPAVDTSGLTDVQRAKARRKSLAMCAEMAFTEQDQADLLLMLGLDAA